MDISKWKKEIVFAVNGRKVVLRNVSTEITLLEYLRDAGFTGTKLGCGEGGCGACTVMVSSLSRLGTVEHRSVNACLAPLCSVDSCAVVTVEGIGSTKSGLHPVQERIAALHGSQCGFCTPGIVMALYAFLRNNPNPTKQQIEESFDGNLCRCTGYRPILDAAKTFADDAKVDGGCCGGMGKNGGCCKMKNKNDDGIEVISSKPGSVKAATDSLKSGYASCTCSKMELHGYGPLEGSAEPIFPPFLRKHVPEPLFIQGFTTELNWYRPVSLSDLLALKATLGVNGKLVGGNSELGIDTKFRGTKLNSIIYVQNVQILRKITFEESHLIIGGAATLSEIRNYCLAELPNLTIEHRRVARVIIDMLRWFASNQIRNVASLAGNIVNASPISDMNPLLLAMDAKLTLSSQARGDRIVPMSSFFLSYRRVDLQNDEVLTSISIPLARKNEYVGAYKQARRRDDDIAIVNGAYRVLLSPVGGKWIVQEAACAFGGMAATTIRSKGAEEALKGAVWSLESLQLVYDALEKDMNLPPNVPGGMPEYRMSLASSFLFKFFVESCNQIDADCKLNSSLPNAPVLSERIKSAGHFLHHDHHTSGVQSWGNEEGGLQTTQARDYYTLTPDKMRGPVGDPIMHKSAREQVTGEAKYTDDISVPPNTLHAALVMSTMAHSEIVKIDTSVALTLPGVVAFYGADDVPGDNHIGAVIHDEELMATKKVIAVGQVIGVIVAETFRQAQAAAKAVIITYGENYPSIISIEDAIAARSYHPEAFNHSLIDGDVDNAMKDCDIIIEGEARCGGQEHFYLETNTSLCIPHEGGMMIHSSTQNPTKTQRFVAKVLDIPESKVVCTVKRMGGGFGGKETRSVFIGCCAAIAAHALDRPVKITIDRDVDMAITGQRHAFIGKYKVGAKKDGTIVAIDVDVFSNAGYSLDLSCAVTDRALFHIFNAYKIPHVRARGFVCKTNTSSNTAFRGFGGPQGMYICETYMEHLSTVLKIPVFELREKNLLSSGDRLAYGQIIKNVNIKRAWDELTISANIKEREKDIIDYNKNNKYRKRGLSMIPTAFGINFTAKFMNQGASLVHVYTDGSVLVTHGGTEMGQGLHTKMAQIAARVFNIEVSKVHINETATDKCANQSPTAASVSSDIYGMAVLDACEKIYARLKPFVETMHGASFKEIVNAAFFERVDLTAHGFFAIPQCGYDWNAIVKTNEERGTPFSYHTYGVSCAEVEIDTLTGDMQVKRADILMDLGASLNAAIDIGQIEGAFVQGMGWCMMEELVWGDDSHKWIKRGNLFTKGPGTYKIPAFNDVPVDFRVSLMQDTKNPMAVHSSKAVGEPPFFMVKLSDASCCFFATRNAILAARAENQVKKEVEKDFFFNLDLPATSERIRMGCSDEIIDRYIIKHHPHFRPNGSW